MNSISDFAPAIAACFDYDHTLDRDKLIKAIHELFDKEKPIPDSQEMLSKLDANLNALTGKRRIALIYGGATKIKDYVFEAPKLPEIRGASALLDWVNEVELPRLWDAHKPKEFAEKGIVYASGGNILAFAPASKGQSLATDIERCYTEQTLTANSVAVYETFGLLELRYGRNPLSYWVEEFEEHWKNPELQPILAQYYYGNAKDTPADRFYRRKAFGELVAVLATKFNRRRDEKAYAGEPRNVPFYPMIPWAEKCDSSDIRPAVWSGTIGDEAAPRQMSEPSARKRAVGQAVKRDEARTTRWFREAFKHWQVPSDLQSWEQQWDQHLEDVQDSAYAQEFKRLTAAGHSIKPPQDLGEIGQASSPGRYVGIIYADGNNVGRLIATQKTPQEYHDNSLILRNAAKNAVFCALAKHLTPKHVRTGKNQDRWMHPFEILAIGGDDLILIVPGDKAFDVALTIGLEFEQRLAGDLPVLHDALSATEYKQRYSAGTPVIRDNYTPSIGLSAGVIVAQENTPIFFLRDLVEELLKKAKSLAKQNVKQGYFGGAVDFMVLKSITMVTDDIKTFREAGLGDGDVRKDEPLRRLTARPYTWHEFAGLLETIRELKKANVPRSQLYRIRRVMQEETQHSTIASTMEYLYTRVRMRRTLADKLQEVIEQNWRAGTLTSNNNRLSIPPWLPLGRQSWETIWPDLIEAYDMT